MGWSYKEILADRFTAVFVLFYFREQKRHEMCVSIRHICNVVTIMVTLLYNHIRHMIRYHSKQGTVSNLILVLNRNKQFLSNVDCMSFIS